MKTLLLLRHAKSDWDDQSLPDFDRPLADRGHRDAPRIGKALAKHGPAPDLIISSPALRATQTTEAVVAAAQLDVVPQFDERIYGAGTAGLMKVIRGLSDSANSALVVGHNPGFEGLVARLTGKAQHMPTAGLASIEFDVQSWADVEDGKGKLIRFLTPKTL
ncbi:MAG TPA: histidine phosphatase family protein [Blastocatellia bacterium]|nr:histidine phosphatase family protein [Blastocatellia bacterium]